MDNTFDKKTHLAPIPSAFRPLHRQSKLPFNHPSTRYGTCKAAQFIILHDMGVFGRVPRGGAGCSVRLCLRRLRYPERMATSRSAMGRLSSGGGEWDGSVCWRGAFLAEM